ncbi:hypothetical protein [Arthrobacter bambusae]|uniref:Uncharacterized protein n=1 Tax=Arthrobacter bambusae TaxID=1338426 RepID=A0AAW8DCU8_9MICC|nr:hypothetical protein [Arthrobacter bambusae]MDP9903115.1 hypothetical protein [Arthrobacter bambusae]MDQ0128891.1 hypothetical protein [Arthrobacter bambusae]MDQ0180232.1 hypothetical protein [Arthrobacter bambusae]
MHWFKESGALVPSHDDLAWLVDRTARDIHFTGSDASGWEDSIWILNAFYELPLEGHVPTHDELHKSRIASGEIGARMINGFNLDADTTTIGSGLGYERRPPAAWRRRTWAEMMNRFPQKIPTDGLLPGHRWFPVRSFPANIVLPTMGSMSEEDFTELINVLTNHSPGTVCSVYFADVWDFSPDPCKAPVYDARIRDLPAVINDAADEHQVFTPANMWPPDRSWLVYTDYDLWATKVSGSTELINDLRANPLLETLDRVPGSALHAGVIAGHRP